MIATVVRVWTIHTHTLIRRQCTPHTYIQPHSHTNTYTHPHLHSPTHSPVYLEEEGEEEVIQEEGVELSLSRLEEEMAIEDDVEDSDDDAPVYLDLSGIKQGRDEEVS